MTVTNGHKDPDALMMAITVELDATVDGRGSDGPTRASSSVCGARRATRDLRRP